MIDRKLLQWENLLANVALKFIPLQHLPLERLQIVSVIEDLNGIRANPGGLVTFDHLPGPVHGAGRQKTPCL